MKVLLWSLTTFSRLRAGTGLSTFVRVLKNDAPDRVRFELTLAHIRDVGDAQMLGRGAGHRHRIELVPVRQSRPTSRRRCTIRCGFSGSRPGTGMPGRGSSLPPPRSTPSTRTCSAAAGCLPPATTGSSDRRSAAGPARVRGMRHWGDFPNSDDDHERGQHDRPAPQRHEPERTRCRAASSATRATTSRSTLDLLLYSTLWRRAARGPLPAPGAVRANGAHRRVSGPPARGRVPRAARRDR